MKAKLIIKDEVNVKIEGLELGTRTALVRKYKFDVPGARYQPAVRLGRWDGKVRFLILAVAHTLTYSQRYSRTLMNRVTILK